MENNTELWKEIVYDLRENRKLSFVDIAKETRDMFPNLTEVQVYDKVRRYGLSIVPSPDEIKTSLLILITGLVSLW